MEIKANTIAHLANLSRLHIAESQMEQYQQDLQKMVAFIEKLNELDTEGVAPLRDMTASSASFTTASSVLREDSVKGSLALDEALQNAPVSHSPYFIVPKVIKK
ncbi:Asp-tRNA(Asn)/Glu-tRNA(Gln) amidotransferase subunit GatC [Sediminibacterium sp. TEGAF015]|uniref:Asp-tRNA(Asn)/Glu-tRNA(Gln) amidotransferase subunit GatC n=1 Tax=Sediminibacterium sp. TEGAF015 TaxID=575378 RepID=UPI0021FC5536|nr:Asp-tRNA(Asn)/Glu-tRNA(Gln) amidotransferase subunit GatC [Sediminibacterium sp. TEGAF015]BDQ13438.1 aspartyl/glutamyl-tRNA(Asn/Gln) amidotransferase subunit C [Sediminibacterium sp. TEGAF015]